MAFGWFRRNEDGFFPRRILPWLLLAADGAAVRRWRDELDLDHPDCSAGANGKSSAPWKSIRQIGRHRNASSGCLHFVQKLVQLIDENRYPPAAQLWVMIAAVEARSGDMELSPPLIPLTMTSLLGDCASTDVP